MLRGVYPERSERAQHDSPIFSQLLFVGMYAPLGWRSVAGSRESADMPEDGMSAPPAGSHTICLASGLRGPGARLRIPLPSLCRFFLPRLAKCQWSCSFDLALG
jgi:hypothetical protein